MRSIRVLQPHHLTVREARMRIEEAACRAAEKYRVVWRWVGDVLEVRPPPGVAEGARGRLLVAEGMAEAQVELPGAYRFVSGRVESRLTQELCALLAC